MLDRARYKQMSGRAGRAGYDLKGESILLCSNRRERDKLVSELFLKPPELGVKSVMTADELSRVVLEGVSSGLVSSMSHMQIFLSQTLRWMLCETDECGLCKDSKRENDIACADAKGSQDDLVRCVSSQQNLESASQNCRNCLFQSAKGAVGSLVAEKFLVLTGGKMVATPLGKGAFASCMGPLLAHRVESELSGAKLAGMRLDTDLHLLYLATVLSAGEDMVPRLDAMLRRMRKFGAAENAVAANCGVSEELVFECTFCGTEPHRVMMGPDCKRRQDMQRLGRFYVAMILNDLVGERPLCKERCELYVGELYKTYEIKRGELQALQTNVGMYSGMLAAFCERTCMPDLALLLRRVAERLSFTVPEELLDLMQAGILRPEKYVSRSSP